MIRKTFSVKKATEFKWAMANIKHFGVLYIEVVDLDG